MVVYSLYAPISIICKPLQMIVDLGEGYLPNDDDADSEVIVAVTTSKRHLKEYLKTHIISKVTTSCADVLSSTDIIYLLKYMTLSSENGDVTLLMNQYEHSLIGLYTYSICDIIQSRINVINYLMGGDCSILGKKITKEFYSNSVKSHMPNEFRIYFDLFNERLKI